MAYEKPSIRDYGALAEMTRATGFFGAEDGGTKALPNHHEPQSIPAGP